MIRNIHSRILKVDVTAAGALLDTLASRGDRLWPHDSWPPIRFPNGLEVGAIGGHGPIRYRIERYNPGKSVFFTFLREKPGLSKGLEGEHSFIIELKGDGNIELRHSIFARAHGRARILWPLLIKPLHEALIEDCLDRAEFELTGQLPDKPARWSSWVKFLRWIIAKRKPRK